MLTVHAKVFVHEWLLYNILLQRTSICDFHMWETIMIYTLSCKGKVITYLIP